MGSRSRAPKRSGLSVDDCIEHLRGLDDCVPAGVVEAVARDAAAVAGVALDELQQHLHSGRPALPVTLVGEDLVEAAAERLGLVGQQPDTITFDDREAISSGDAGPVANVGVGLDQEVQRVEGEVDGRQCAVNDGGMVLMSFSMRWCARLQVQALVAEASSPGCGCPCRWRGTPSMDRDV